MLSRYYFQLHTQDGVLLDDRGTEFHDDSTAMAHARQVVRELIKNEAKEARHWTLNVRNAWGMHVGKIHFAAMNETLELLPVEYREVIERTAMASCGLRDVILELRKTLTESRALLAQAKQEQGWTPEFQLIEEPEPLG